MYDTDEFLGVKCMLFVFNVLNIQNLMFWGTPCFSWLFQTRFWNNQYWRLKPHKLFALRQTTYYIGWLTLHYLGTG